MKSRSVGRGGEKRSRRKKGGEREGREDTQLVRIFLRNVLDSIAIWAIVQPSLWL